jgi:hypothetical protein
MRLGDYNRLLSFKAQAALTPAGGADTQVGEKNWLLGAWETL